LGGLERAKREEGGGKGKGILLRVPFGFFFFFLKGGRGRNITFFICRGFFWVSGGKWGGGGGIESFFLGEKGDLLYIRRGGGLGSWGFSLLKKKGWGEGFGLSKEKKTGLLVRVRR